ncbi:SMI1/KNR4 family protein [Nocardia cyriacigeorgica]|uniref:SMI1/KNR4 family protein n=1 Tax=Nocardia cyriacigeorgica TaxID=135487 RepID=UPI001893A1F5|nr:SMI1/KNR4 family protein [Nocardia cyriacigeorgica]MBF6397214.1 SMI1/KNR4 family protein [Nocardia cyriacigeorgica]MBF6403128.1 SMI1/KNR4 family protein [Nocardia cyriacigeorgica]
MNEQFDAAVDRIRYIHSQVVEGGLRPETMTGATDDEIDDFAARQGVSHLPVAVREVLRLVGKESGLWFIGTDFGVASGIDSTTREHAIASLSGLEHGLRDPGGILVLSAHQAYAYDVIDGADLNEVDPPVWTIVEKESARKWPSVSDWFAGTEPLVEDYREKLEIMDTNGATKPFWAEYISPRWASTPPSPDPRQRMREITESVYVDGLSRDSVVGASDLEIDAFAQRQGVNTVPAAVREMLRLIGRNPGLWFRSAEFGVVQISADAKAQAISAVHRNSSQMRDPDGMLVLAAYPGSDYFVIDGSDIDQADPPVWWIFESKYARKEWGSTTGWLDAKRPDIRRLRSLLHQFEEQGKPIPDWARYLS